jgi:hypothetical protein
VYGESFKLEWFAAVQTRTVLQFLLPCRVSFNFVSRGWIVSSHRVLTLQLGATVAVRWYQE